LHNNSRTLAAIPTTYIFKSPKNIDNRRQTNMKHRRQGRPALSADAKRRNRVAVRLTDTELQQLQTEADERHVAISVWLRIKSFSDGTTATA
jgi:hypothetical protein